MSKYNFSDLPANYQEGCHNIERECQAALAKANVSVDTIGWCNLGLMACHLNIHAFNRRFTTKFGKLALLTSDDPNMQKIISCRLQFLIGELIQARRRDKIK